MMGEMSLSDVVPGMKPDTPQQSGRRAAARQRERRRRRRRRRALLALVLSVAVVGGAVAASWAGLAPVVQRFTEPNDYTGSGAGEVKVKIAPGSSGVAIGKVLADAGVVKTSKAFVEAAEKDRTRAASIQPGTYRMRSQMSAATALGMLLDPKARLQLSVTIPEGKRLPQTLDLLAEQLGLDRDALEAAAKDPAEIGLTAGTSKGNAEGFLFPLTYEFEPDVTATDVLRRMTQQSAKVLRETGLPPAKWREVVIKASLVQAEAGRVEDMGKVARVMENRLATKTPLQLDSTVSFAVNRYNITTTAKERAVDSPYNTYRIVGLPSGPINSPGADAIDAVLKPEPGPWRYFVTVNPDTGETRFAETEAEHLANVKVFQAWLRRQ